MLTPSVFTWPVQAGFSTRSGGVSPMPYGSLNLGLSTADSNENVLQNRTLAAAHFGLTRDDMAIAGQVHGSSVLTVDTPGLFPGYDGLVTNKPGLLLSISAADCAAVLLADPISGVIGACHAGWRGHVAAVVDHTLEAMVQLGANPSRVQAYIGPCISVDRFEVGEEVAAQFGSEFVERKPEWPKPHINLTGSIRSNLIRCGVDSLTIEASEQCTMTDSDFFFSHRGQQGVTGRMMGFICISASS